MPWTTVTVALPSAAVALVAARVAVGTASVRARASRLIRRWAGRVRTVSPSEGLDVRYFGRGTSAVARPARLHRFASGTQPDTGRGTKMGCGPGTGHRRPPRRR